MKNDSDSLTSSDTDTISATDIDTVVLDDIGVTEAGAAAVSDSNNVTDNDAVDVTDDVFRVAAINDTMGTTENDAVSGINIVSSSTVEIDSDLGYTSPDLNVVDNVVTPISDSANGNEAVSVSVLQELSVAENTVSTYIYRLLASLYTFQLSGKTKTNTNLSKHMGPQMLYCAPISCMYCINDEMDRFVCIVLSTQ